MPSVQRGWLGKRDGAWAVRWYDHDGKRRRKGCFETKGEASTFLAAKLDEVTALRRGDPVALRRRDVPTFRELVDEYLAQHTAEANTIRTLRHRLKRALDTFGETRVDRIVVSEVKAWRKTLPERSAWHYTKALRQVLNYAVAAKLIDDNPAKAVPNPEPKRREVPAFESWADVEAVADELDVQGRAIVLLAAGTGLRPEEWIALERGDVDVKAGTLTVRRVYTDGQVKLFGKQDGSLRTVPLPAHAAEAVRALPARLDTRRLFTGDRGGYVSLARWRANDWTTAVRAAGLEHRTPYALRHTYATFSIAAGVPLFYLARFMGTSVEQIDRTYGHLLPDSLDQARGLLDAFLATDAADAAGGKT